MTKLAAAIQSVLLATALRIVQAMAKFVGVPKEFVTPKNPPAPGPDGMVPETLSGRLYKASKRMFEHFGDPAALLFLMAEEYESKAIDSFIDIVTGRTLRRDYRATASAHLVHQTRLAAGATIGKHGATYVQQAKNSRYIYTLVRNNPETLGIPTEGEFDLALFMERAYAVGDFEAIWTVEGLGHVYSQRMWQLKWGCSEWAEGIMVEGQAAEMPRKSLTMLHAGLGLGLAESLMKQLTPGSGAREVERVLRAFIGLCTKNSQRGYVGCALESLGLVTRVFNYPMVNVVETVLADIDDIAWEFFWRGAGRALYFAPGHWLQPLYSPWIAAEQEAPNDRVHAILKAGIAWPTNIVNMRHPAIMEHFIRSYGVAEENTGTIVHGVAASTAMACDVTPNHPLVRKYIEYVPTSSDSGVRELWTKLVREPAYNALHRYQPVLRKHEMMDEVFRFQDLDALVNRLDPPRPTTV